MDLLEAEGDCIPVRFPNNTEVLARANLTRKNPIKLEAVSCFGQGLTAEQRNFVSSESFGARGLAIYSSEEGGLIGCQCGDSIHYHLNSEIVFVEILIPMAWLAAPANRAELLLHHFSARHCRSFSYDQGDTAELHQSCTCSSRLTVIKKILVARSIHAVSRRRSLGNGVNQKLMRENLNALVFQLAQVATFKLEIRFVPDVPQTVQAGPITAHIRELIHPNLDVIFRPVKNPSIRAENISVLFVKLHHKVRP